VQFDGVGDCILSPDIRPFLPDESLTVELWFKAERAGVLIDERGQSPLVPGWQFSMMEILASGDLVVGVYNLNPLTVGRATFGEWHHTALRYNKATLTLDGLLDGIPSAAQSKGDRSAPAESGVQEILAFGLGDAANMGSGAYFKGEIDEVRIWNFARKTEDIQTMLGRVLTGSEAGLVAYWRFDEAAGPALDFSGHGNDGKFLGNPNWTISATPRKLIYALSDPASALTPTSVVFNGRTFQTGPSTSAYFQWGDSTNLSNQTRSESLPQQILSQPVSAAVSGLSSAVPYYYRLVIVDPTGVHFGKIMSFTTPGTGSGRALDFDGNSAYLATPNLNSVLDGGTITIELWFKTTFGGILVDERGQTPPNLGWQYSLLEVFPGGLIKMRVFPFGSTDLGIATVDQWHHVAIRYDKAARRLDGFLDGAKLAGVDGVRAAPSENGYGTYFGIGLYDEANMGGGHFFTGQIDEIRIWKTARSDAEIRLNRFRRFSRPQAGLVANWSCDELDGSVAYDSSGLFNDARLSNSNLRASSTAPIFEVTPIAKSTNGTIRLQFLSEAGQTVRLDASSDLQNWTSLITNTVPAYNLFQFEEDSANHSTRFYRLRAP
jgi:hypothetical protein